MLTGILLDNDVFTHVDVSNGKLINDGDRTAVIGLALPGLQDNLGIGETPSRFPIMWRSAPMSPILKCPRR